MPIDLSKGSPREQYDEAAGWVASGIGRDHVIFNPFSAFYNAGESALGWDLAFVPEVNNFVINNCDMGVFIWNDSPSFGVPLEIAQFVDREKPVIVVNNTDGFRRLGLYLRSLAGRDKISIVEGCGGLKGWFEELNAAKGPGFADLENLK